MDWQKLRILVSLMLPAIRVNILYHAHIHNQMDQHYFVAEWWFCCYFSWKGLRFLLVRIDFREGPRMLVCMLIALS